MSITVRLIFLLLLFTLAFGVWGITLLLDESARKRALWAEATGGAGSKVGSQSKGRLPFSRENWFPLDYRGHLWVLFLRWWR